MNDKIGLLFDDKDLVEKIKVKLPYLFQLVDLENSRAGKVGMQAGSAREPIIIALLIYKFGEQNVETKIPITEPEIDVKLFGNPISIKTKTKDFSGIRLKWTSDTQKSIEFSKEYSPSCDMIFVHIKWNNVGGFYFIPKEIQIETLRSMGYKNYIKLSTGTNNRGPAFTSTAIKQLIDNPRTMRISIDWKKRHDIDFNPYTKWIDLWQMEAE